MGPLIFSLFVGLVAVIRYKIPNDWYPPFLRWWKSEEMADEIQYQARLIHWFAER